MLINLFCGDTAAGEAFKQLLDLNKIGHLCLESHYVVCMCNTLVTANLGQSLSVSSLSIPSRQIYRSFSYIQNQ